MSESLLALFHPFTKGILPMPDQGRIVFIRAQASPLLRSFTMAPLVCEQTFKPEVDRLEALGLHVVRRGEGPFKTVLCLLTKHKAENLSNLARAWMAIEPGGLVVCAGPKETGAASVERRLREVLGDLEGLSKHHGRVFWARKTIDATPAPLLDWAEQGKLQRVHATGFLSQPGIFGWDKIDAGSSLLADYMASGIGSQMGGTVADLGAGYGYLSAEILERCRNIVRLDLFEAEWLALDAARANMAERAPKRNVQYHWHDVTGGLPGAGYDWVVMNPPFHSGKSTDLDLGRAFIAAGVAALAPGGRLLMVANRHLPYEPVLARFCPSPRIVAQTAAFKVLEARR